MSKQIWQQERVAIVGVGATVQGAHPGKSSYQLGVEALKRAMADAGLNDKSKIDGVIGAQQYDQSGIDAVVLSRYLGLNPKVTAALDYCTGGFATQHAAMLIATGTCDLVACVYGRNPAGSMEGYSGGIVYDDRHGLFNAAGTAALGWSRYMKKYGVEDGALGPVAVAARKHAQLSDIAAWKDEPLSLEDYLASPHVLWPFREHDICKLTAGGVAIILARADMAKDFAKPPVYLHAVGRRQAARALENDDHLLCYAMKDVASQVFSAAGMSPDDVDVLNISDASTAAVIHTLENYGFCPEGQGTQFVADGEIEIGGRCPVNPSGGQLGEGYLVGYLHHVELVRQLRHEAGPRQVANAEVAQYMATGRFREDFLSSIYVRP
jgi:acetyl-CoA acetyltransferase